MTTTPDPAAYPTREEDATAERMCRWLTRSAWQRAERVDALRPAVTDPDGNPKGGPEWPLFAAENAALVNTWSLVFLLRSLLPEQDDRMARALWRAWADEARMRETLAEWAAEYGQAEPEECGECEEPLPPGVDRFVRASGAVLCVRCATAE